MKNYKTKIISDNYKDVYSIPYTVCMTKDKKYFHYSEIGVLCSCLYHKKNVDYQENWHDKFVLHISYDYRSADNLNNFGFVKHTGTFGKNIFCDSIEEAIQKMFEFLDSEFVLRDFSGEIIPQKNKATVREVAKAQSLHHIAGYYKLYEGDSIYKTIIINSGQKETLEKYINTYKNREKTEFKYKDKINKKFKDCFSLDIRPFINGSYTFPLQSFFNAMNTDYKNFKEYYESLTKEKQSCLKHIINYYK